MVDRYYNSWIEDTDQVVDEDSLSTVSAGQSQASRPEVPPDSPAAGDHDMVDVSRKSADNDLSGWNVSTSQDVDDDDGSSDEDDDDVDDDDDNDVFRSFM